MNRLLVAGFAALAVAIGGLPAHGAAAKAQVSLTKASIKLPDSVAKTFKKTFPKGEVTKLDVDQENGVTVYDIEFKDGAIEKETDITADGTMLEFTVVVDAKALPQAFVPIIRKAAAGATIKRIERIEISYDTKDGKAVKLAKPITRYAVEMARGAQTAEVVVAPDGAVVEPAKWGGAQPQAAKATSAAVEPDSEVTVPLEKTPAKVRATIQQQAKGAKIQKVEIVTEKGKKVYDIEIQKNGKTTEFSVSLEGKYLGVKTDEDQPKGEAGKKKPQQEKKTSKGGKKVAKHEKEEKEDEDNDKDEAKHEKKKEAPKGGKKVAKHEKEEKEDEDNDKDEAKHEKKKEASKGGKKVAKHEKEEKEDEDNDKDEAKHEKKKETPRGGKKVAEQAKGTSDGFASKFDVAKGNLANVGKNPYFIPLEPGYRMILEGGGGTLTITVTHKTKLVDGVETRVIEEREEKDGKLEEVSQNYFAIDKKTGAVYYFGEDVDMYKDGKMINHEGSWLSGVHGAKFGLMMPGKPKVGDKFQQEIAPKVAMDRCEIVSMDAQIKTPAGTFKKCLRTKDGSALESGTSEKVYAPGVGLVKDDEFLLTRIAKTTVSKKKKGK